MTYLDSGPIMRLIEGSPETRGLILVHFSDVFATSVISIADCRIVPLRERDDSRAARFDQLFSINAANVYDVNPEIARRAAEVRARYNLKLPDAIHIATAASLRCEKIVTTDRDFLRVSGASRIEIVIIPAT